MYNFLLVLLAVKYNLPQRLSSHLQEAILCFQSEFIDIQFTNKQSLLFKKLKIKIKRTLCSLSWPATTGCYLHLLCWDSMWFYAHFNSHCCFHFPGQTLWMVPPAVRSRIWPLTWRHFSPFPVKHGLGRSLFGRRGCFRHNKLCRFRLPESPMRHTTARISLQTRFSMNLSECAFFLVSTEWAVHLWMCREKQKSNCDFSSTGINPRKFCLQTDLLTHCLLPFLYLKKVVLQRSRVILMFLWFYSGIRLRYSPTSTWVSPKSQFVFSMCTVLCVLSHLLSH